ncbi:MAG: 50S ribosomal protein L4 [Bacteroidota bacterium]
MNVAVVNQSGEDTGRKVSLAKEVYGIEPNDHAIYLDVKQYLANQRQGTHKTKERAEIVGSTKKIKKQKGTGTARAGSIKSPIFKGGGRVFGPQPRDYSFKLNKKLKILARKSALSYKAKDKRINVIEDLSYEAPKTKAYVDMLRALSATNTKTLLVLGEVDKNVVLSSRNLKNANIVTADSLNTYHVLDADTLILSESSVEKINNLLNS